MAARSYALPLFALVDKSKVDPRSPQLPELAERLAGYLAANHSIDSIHAEIIPAAEQPVLVLHGVEAEGLPRLFALADIQHAQVFEFKRDEEDRFTLRPLAVKPAD